MKLYKHVVNLAMKDLLEARKVTNTTPRQAYQEIRYHFHRARNYLLSDGAVIDCDWADYNYNFAYPTIKKYVKEGEAILKCYTPATNTEGIGEAERQDIDKQDLIIENRIGS